MREHIIDTTETNDFNLTPFDGYCEVWGEVREEIVRCRDCEHYRSHELFPIESAPDICIRIPYGINVEPNGFCKWAKKKLLTEETIELFEEWGSDDQVKR